MLYIKTTENIYSFATTEERMESYTRIFKAEFPTEKILKVWFEKR